MSVGFVKGMLPDLTKKYEVVLLSSPGPEMDEAREQYGVRTIEVPMERHISPVKDFLSLCRLILVFLKEKPDMVHSMTPKAGLLCMTAAWLTRVPVRIHTFTGLVWPTSTGLKRRILMLTDAITCWCATHVIPEGEGVKADLLNNGITRKPLRILGYGNVRGIDMQRFKKTTDDSDIFSHADLADHADNLYFDHGSTRIHTDFLKTKNYTLKTVPPTDDTDRHGKVKTKTNGIIIPPRDTEALYEAMKMMVTDDNMRGAMAKNARQMIESRFEQGFVRKCLYDFYEETL